MFYMSPSTVHCFLQYLLRTFYVSWVLDHEYSEKDKNMNRQTPALQVSVSWDKQTTLLLESEHAALG